MTEKEFRDCFKNSPCNSMNYAGQSENEIMKTVSCGLYYDTVKIIELSHGVVKLASCVTVDSYDEVSIEDADVILAVSLDSIENIHVLHEGSDDWQFHLKDGAIFQFRN